VKIFATLFAKVFVRALFFALNSNAETMLPNFAGIALNEYSCEIFRNICFRERCNFTRVFDALFAVFFVNGGWAWIFVEAADAANRFVILDQFVCTVDHFYRVLFGRFILIFRLPTLSTST
jgi:hypothetical protein